MKAKLKYIGEWVESDFSDSYEKAQEMGLDDLMEILGVKGGVDLRILMAGYRTLLGCYFEDGTATYSLEVIVPLIAEEGTELKIPSLEKTIGVLKELKKMGFYLLAQSEGCVDCYRTGTLTELREELENVLKVLSKKPLERS